MHCKWAIAGAFGSIFLMGTAAFAATISVDASDVIYSPAGATADGSGLPAAGPIAVGGGDTLTFSVPSTETIFLGIAFNDADGIAVAPSSSLGLGSLSGITVPTGSLVGVFVPAGGPTGPAPGALNYTTTSSTSSSSYAPLLDQVFFIGDGLTGDGTGTTQTFLAPTGAALLYLGISDACAPNGVPSCYGDNSGTFNVTYTDSSATPLPATLPLFATGLGALGLFGWRRRRNAQLVA